MPFLRCSKILGEATLGARDFSGAVSGFCQVFIVTRAKSFSRGFAARGFGLRPKLCRPSADTKNSRRTRRPREKPLVPRVEGRQASKKFYSKSSENSRSQIVFGYSPKIDVGCPWQSNPVGRIVVRLVR